MNYVLMIMLTCAEVQKINTSDEAWNAHDDKTLEISKTRCVKEYPDAPCVKVFHKTEPQSYRVVCAEGK